MSLSTPNPNKWEEIAFLFFGFLKTSTWIFLESYLPWLKQPSLDQLYQPKVLSRYLKKDVESVQINQEKLSEGAGSTGTSRNAIIATLTDQTKLYLFVKTPASTFAERVFLGMFKVYDNEMSFYEKICDQLLDKSSSWQLVPRVYHASKKGLTNFLLIMEDIRFRPEDCIFKTILETPFDVEGEKLLMKQYARLHAKFWKKVPTCVWRRSKETGLSIGNTPPRLRVFSEVCYQGLLKRFEGKIQFYDSVKEALLLVITDYDSLYRYSAQVANTMIHGDAHMGNVFLSGDRTRVGLVDFQCVSEGNGLYDIAYHLLFSCPTEVLVEHEESFIRVYLEELRAALLASANPQDAEEVPSYEEAFRLYRLHAIYALLAATHTLGLVQMIADDYSTSLLTRCIEGCHRLRTNEVLKEILLKK